MGRSNNNKKERVMKDNTEFVAEFIEILGGDDFFLCDLVDQDDLYKMQNDLANLIAESANSGTSIAKFIADLLPQTFQTEKV
jgi:hypothetical protein